MRPGNLHRFALGALSIVSAAPCCGARNSHTPIAPTRMVAQYGSGESDWISWKTTIDEHGNGVQTPYGEKSRTFKLTDGRRIRLLRCLRTEKFWSLPESYPATDKDGPTLILSVTSAGHSHTVVASLPSRIPKDRRLTHFLRIWSEVLRAFPSPNAAQTPALYRP